MVYTKPNVQFIDIKRIETGSDSAFNGKVLSSLERISRIRKNIKRNNWYVFTTNKYKAMVYKRYMWNWNFARQLVMHE